MKNEICIRLSVFDGGDNNEITKILDIIPTKVCKKGSLISSRGTMVYKYNIWKYEINLKDVVHIEEALTKLLTVFQKKKNELSLISQKQYIEISISAYIEDGMPSIHISNEFISFF